ncbi:hypothetical protein [Bosea sp. F3-2]|uniref:hypothetical protein n=1 Tax=Bosea sp. F3-2 TaxID=2599640 RepID=UPI0020C0CA0E|nr:hypothetical protein [Bosea sp. F3-2]
MSRFPRNVAQVAFEHFGDKRRSPDSPNIGQAKQICPIAIERIRPGKVDQQIWF